MDRIMKRVVVAFAVLCGVLSSVPADLQERMCALMGVWRGRQRDALRVKSRVSQLKWFLLIV